MDNKKIQFKEALMMMIAIMIQILMQEVFINQLWLRKNLLKLKRNKIKKSNQLKILQQLKFNLRNNRYHKSHHLLMRLKMIKKSQVKSVCLEYLHVEDRITSPSYQWIKKKEVSVLNHQRHSFSNLLLVQQILAASLNLISNVNDRE